MNKRTALITISDGKGNPAALVQDRITEMFTRQPAFGVDVNHVTWAAFQKTAFYKKHKTQLDNPNPLMNGRAYVPYVIGAALAKAAAGDFVIYSDSSPEIWEVALGADLTGFDLDVIKELCVKADDILAVQVRWTPGAFSSADDPGVATFKNFTINSCLDKMGLRALENCYMPARLLWCFRKSRKSTAFLSAWLKWSMDPDCLPKDPNVLEQGKLGLVIDQSISGLLLAKSNHRLLVAPAYMGPGDLHPMNFLSYCRRDLSYVFMESNPEHITV